MPQQCCSPHCLATTAAAATQVGWSRVADMAAARHLVDCTRPGVTWKATVTPDIGRYNAGNADINATALGCNGDRTSCDLDQLLRGIKLTGR